MADRTRSARYTNLRPGPYRLEVKATSDLGWAPLTASAVFFLKPHFYQTRWFFGLCALGAGLVVFSMFRLRVAGVRKRFSAVLAERNRIARDLHDTLAQTFTGLGYQLVRLDKRFEDAPPENRALIRDARTLLDHCRLEARYALADLRSQTLHGRTLGEALADLRQQAELFGNTEVTLTVAGTPVPAGHEIEDTFLRVAQEAVINAVVHGGARHVSLKLSGGPHEAVLEITDDGQGFAVDAQPTGENSMHFGLLGMRERAARVGGEVTIVSRPGAGALVTIRAPLGGRKT